MRRLVFLLFAIFSFNLIYSQAAIPYQIGETAKYNIYFGPVAVGYASLTVKKTINIKGKKTYHIIGEGRTVTFFDWFFKVRDRYETYIDTETLLPVRFERNVYEGGYEINQSYRYIHDQNIVLTKDSIYQIQDESQDMLSAFFYARTLDKKIIQDNKTFYIPIFMDEENYILEVEYLYNELIKSKTGEIKCMVFKPKMQEGRVFQDGEKMKIWISDDSRHLLIKVETHIWAGVIKAELSDYKEK